MPIADPAALSPYFDAVGSAVVVAGGTVTRVARGRGNRILLALSTTSSGVYFFSPKRFNVNEPPRLTTSPVAGAALSFIGTYRIWGPTIGFEWYLQSSVAATIEVLEVILTPPPEWTFAEYSQVASQLYEGTDDASSIELLKG